jgi:alkylation response protein AidB-like acyl-CoA dehydrogenase
VDFELAPDDDPRRQEIRAWLAEHPQPTGEQLARAGYVAPHWPRPWGLDADPMHQLIIDEELKAARVARPQNAIGIGWAGPTILYAGTDDQKARYLWPILTGEEVWCQMFSEPEAGSDLASLATRAVRDGDRYIVNGSKIWTSGAHRSRFGILIARTDPNVAKHKGISYFICPTDLRGIEMRPIIDTTGTHSFNQVFYTDVELPAENLVGAEGDGWRLAKVTLGNERVSLSGEGALWGSGPSAFDLVDLVRRHGGLSARRTSTPVSDAATQVFRQQLAALYAEATCLQLIRYRTLTAALRGEAPGPEASVRKALADAHGRRIMEVAKDLAGAAGMLTDSGPLGDTTTPTGVRGTLALDSHLSEWHYGFLFGTALEIGGGTAQVQRNIIAERVLGLPHDVDVQAGLSWSETRRSSGGERTSAQPAARAAESASAGRAVPG